MAWSTTTTDYSKTAKDGEYVMATISAYFEQAQLSQAVYASGLPQVGVSYVTVAGYWQGDAIAAANTCSDVSQVSPSSMETI